MPDDLRAVSGTVKARDPSGDVCRDPAVKAAPGKQVMEDGETMVCGSGLMHAFIAPGDDRLQLARIGPEGDGHSAPSLTDFLDNEPPYIAGSVGEPCPFRAGEVRVDEVEEGLAV